MRSTWHRLFRVRGARKECKLQYGLRKESAMLRSIVLLAALCALWPLSSQGAQYGRDDADRASDQQAPQRYDRQNQGRQQQSDRGGGDRRDSLTPDERRDLRRDLQRAKREFYRKDKRRSRNR
jgi:hypothetical protein